MKFSTKTTYGLRALVYLAKQPADQPVSLTTIAKAEKISVKYLEIIFSALKKAKLVKSSQGATGGYTLVQSLAEINTYQVVKALEKDLTVFHCISETGKIHCSQACNCGVSLVLPRVQQAIIKTLKDLKLNQLIK